MKFGLKLWSSNTDLIEQAIQVIDKKFFDYIELFVVPNTEISPFIIDVPYIIHIPHQTFGVNIGDASKKKYNLQRIDESITWADKLNAKYLILHAGDGSIEPAIDVICQVKDSRLLIENMPKVGLDNEKMIGYSSEQIQKLIENSNMGLCLDFGHAIKAAISLGEDYKKYVGDFLKFNPRVFHFSDGMLSGEKDEHLNIGEGEFDFGYLLGFVERNNSKLVTLETPRGMIKSLDADIQNVQVLKDEIRLI